MKIVATTFVIVSYPAEVVKMAVGLIVESLSFCSQIEIDLAACSLSQFSCDDEAYACDNLFSLTLYRI